MVIPKPAINFTNVLTSFRFGTLVKVIGESAKIIAASRGKAAFFAPEMRTSPSSLVPPEIKNLSINYYAPKRLALRHSSLVIARIVTAWTAPLAI